MLVACGDNKRELYEKYVSEGGTKTYEEWLNESEEKTNANGVNDGVFDAGVKEEDTGLVKDEITKTLRTEKAVITDSGRVNQQVDICYLPYDLYKLEEAGYKYLHIKISFVARENDDGYQYIFLYNSSDCQGAVESSIIGDMVPGLKDDVSDGLLWSTRFELGSGKLDTSWVQKEFSFYILTRNVIQNLWIRYGASGNYGDNWSNKEVVITVTPCKTME